MRYKIQANDMIALPNTLLSMWRAGLVPDSVVRVYLCLRRLSLSMMSEFPELPEPMTTKQLADYCGLSNATLRRALQTLHEMRYIEYDKEWIVVKD